MEKKVLQDGKIIPLSAKHVKHPGLHTHVLAFIRHTKDEMALIIINFNDHNVDTIIDMNNIRLAFEGMNIRGIALVMEDWTN